ncbi:T9SS type A sorting domain-containing protein [bacterium AH-315-C20]|nr:T9SS type A sorting domain-containing protein [bacterium AH-315-C20]
MKSCEIIKIKTIAMNIATKRITKIALTLTLCFGMSTIAGAVARTWVGSGAGGSSTNFNVSTNWSPAGTPTSADALTMTITANGSCTVFGDITVGSLNIEVTGNKSWYFRCAGSIVTVNGSANFNAKDWINPGNYSYLSVDCDGLPGGFIFNGPTQLHTTGAGDTYITANSGSEGTMTFNDNLTIGIWAYTSPGVEPSWRFDGTGTQTVTNNSNKHFKPASFTFGIANSPDVNIVNNQSNETYFTVYDGNVSINNAADVHIGNLNFDSWTGAGTWSTNGTGTLRIGSNSDFPAAYSSRTVTSTSTTSYEGNLSQTVTALPGGGYGHLRIAGTGTKTSAASFDIRGDFISEGTWADGADTHTFDGTANQDIRGTVTPQFENMIVNKASGTLFIEINTQVDQVLTMTNGPIDLSDGTSGFDLYIMNTSTGGINWSSGSGAYLISEKTDVTGTLSWDINSSSGTHIVPFGNTSGVEIPLYLTRTAGDCGIITSATYPTPDDNTPYPPTVTSVQNATGADNSPNTVNRFWQISKTGAGTTTVRFYYADADVPTNGEADLQPQRWSGSQWETHASSSPGGFSNSPANNYGEGTGITSYSPWTLSSFATPLPIVMTDLGTNCDSDGDVWVSWTTGSELNNDYFEIERSINGIDWASIGIEDGHGNSSVEINYAYKDRDPAVGFAYYRLKQVDFDGKVEYHGPVSTASCESGSFNVYLSNGILNLAADLDSDEDLDITIYNAAGQVVSIFHNSAPSGLTVFEIGNRLSPGLYVVGITTGSGIEEVIKFVCP